MPVFHFNITDGLRLFNPRGLDLPNVEAARLYAQQLARGFYTAVQPPGLEVYVEVIDQMGEPIGRFAVTDGKG
jgi:hypothetical protein